MTTTDIAWGARQRQFWSTPYDKGNLAQSIGDLSGFGSEISYQAFNKNTRAEYGAILNDQVEITYKITLRGKTYTGTYVNKHYKWFDNFVSEMADLIDLENGTIRG